MAANALTINLLLRAKQFERQMGKVARVMERVKKRAEKVAIAARKMFLVSAAAATAATVSFARFEHRMARVGALSSATKTQLEELSKVARQLGKETQFSANQAADAMAEFALQGFKTNQIIAAMRPTLNLAAVGQIDMGQTARIAAGIMRGMSLDITQLSRIVDLLAKATISSATDIGSLGDAMRALGPIAAASGVSIEETVAILRAFADVMIQGSSAGTQLRNVLIRLQAQPTEVKKALDDLGVSVADARGDFRSLADIVDDLNVAMVNLTGTERTAIIARLAGLRAIAGFTTLLSLGGDVIRKYTVELEKSGGVAKRVATQQLDTLAGSFKLLTSAISETAIRVGTFINVGLRPFTEQITKLIGWINQLNDVVFGIGVTVGLLTIGFTAIAVVLPLVTGAIAATIAVLAKLGVSIGILSLALGALLFPISIVTAAFVATTAFLASIGIGFLVAGKAVDKFSSALEADNAAAVDLSKALAKLRVEEKEGTRRSQIKAIQAVIVAEKARIETLKAEAEANSRYIQTEKDAAEATADLQVQIESFNKSIAERTVRIEELTNAVITQRKAELALEMETEAATESIETFIKALELERDTFGMTARAAAIFELSLDGLTETQEAAVRSIDNQIAALERWEEHIESVRAAGEAENARLNAFSDTLAELNFQINKNLGLISDRDIAAHKFADGTKRSREELDELIDTELELQDAIAGRIEREKEARQQKKRAAFTSGIEGALQLFRRIQVSAASGPTADPEGTAKELFREQKKGNTLTKEQTSVLEKIQKKIDNLAPFKVRFG